ncbi:MAG: dihydrodipicolinate synthase family protein [Bryobacteraceae bacterium]
MGRDSIRLHGIFPALTTCFDHNGNLYKTKIFHNVSKLNQIALAGYVVGGSTGETPLLTSEERIQVMEWVREASGEGRTLIAGVGAESVHETVLLANRAAEAGYHVALALTPHYYRNQMQRPDIQGLYFRSIADKSKIPVLIYNIPAVTGYNLSVEIVAQLSEHPNIIGIKDSSGNMQKLAEFAKAVKPGFQLLTGSGPRFSEALELGAAGAILAIANALPYVCVTIWEAFRRREIEAARDWQARMLHATELVPAKHGVAGLKHAMDLNGYYGGPPRLPLIPPATEARSEIEAALDGLRS